MQVCHTIDDIRDAVKGLRRSGKKVGFVPTMGNLHEGHLSLVRKAKQVADAAVVSIFVNPLQFGENEDFDAYPRTLEADCDKLTGVDAELVFAPSVNEVYPRGQENLNIVQVPDALSTLLCGEFRPGHFDGVATVVTKLFGMVTPDVAFFGEKDFQQLVVIKRMTEDLSLPVEVIGQPTVREQDGLAMSSRNGYLSEQERETAPFLFQTLQETMSQITVGGKTDFRALVADAELTLREHGFRPQYYRICRQDDLLPAVPGDKRLVILVAAHLGQTRLIDNIRFELK